MGVASSGSCGVGVAPRVPWRVGVVSKKPCGVGVASSGSCGGGHGFGGCSKVGVASRKPWGVGVVSSRWVLFLTGSFWWAWP